MGGEVINTIRPQISFASQSVAPPSPLYIHRDDNLNVQVWNALASATVVLRARLLLPEGTVVRVEREFALTSARALNQFSLNLTEGFLLDLTLNASVGVPRRGQMYALVRVVHGDPDLAQDSLLLLADYVEQMKPATWPHSTPHSSLEGRGMLRSITGTNPAAGAEISETVPTNARWKLLEVTFSLVT